MPIGVALFGGTAPTGRAAAVFGGACAPTRPAAANASVNAEAATTRNGRVRPRISDLTRRILRVCGGRSAPISLASPRVDFPLHDRAFRHRQPRRDDVAVDRRRRLQHDALVRGEVAGYRAADGDCLRGEIGLHVGARSNHQAVIADFDGAFNLPVNREVLLADDAPLDAERLADPRGDAALIGGRIDVVRHLTPCCRESYLVTSAGASTPCCAALLDA